MYNLITERELAAIDRYILETNDFLCTNFDRDYFGDVDTVIQIDPEKRTSLDVVLKPWEESKKDLFNLFGNKLILEKNVSFTLDENTFEDRVRSFLEGTDWAIIRELICRKIKIFSIKNKEITIFSSEGHVKIEDDTFAQELILNDIEDLFSPSVLSKNIYSGHEMVFSTDSKKFILVPGMRAIKAINKLCSFYGLKDEFERFRASHSQIYTLKEIKGTLCLSIHPLDYMTMSDNESNWSSCMSWRKKGCYRQGTVEMMNSPYVVVAYLKSENDMLLNTCGQPLPWSNKKWRQLFIVHPDIIIGIKGYPYCSDALTDFALNWLKELAEKDNSHTFGPYEDEAVGFKNQEWQRTFGQIDLCCFENYTTTDVRVAMATEIMYNDFYGLHNLKAYCKKGVTDIYVKYSGSSEYMSSGKTDFHLEGEYVDLPYEEFSHLLVDPNSKKIYGNCSSCQGELYSDNLILHEGKKYCKGCFFNSFYIDAFSPKLATLGEEGISNRIEVEKKKIHVFTKASWLEKKLFFKDSLIPYRAAQQCGLIIRETEGEFYVINFSTTEEQVCELKKNGYFFKKDCLMVDYAPDFFFNIKDFAEGTFDLAQALFGKTATPYKKGIFKWGYQWKEGLS